MTDAIRKVPNTIIRGAASHVGPKALGVAVDPLPIPRGAIDGLAEPCGYQGLADCGKRHTVVGRQLELLPRAERLHVGRKVRKNPRFLLQYLKEGDATLYRITRRRDRLRLSARRRIRQCAVLGLLCATACTHQTADDCCPHKTMHPRLRQQMTLQAAGIGRS